MEQLRQDLTEQLQTLAKEFMDRGLTHEDIVKTMDDFCILFEEAADETDEDEDGEEETGEDINQETGAVKTE